MINLKLWCDSRERQSTLGLFPKDERYVEHTMTVGDYSIMNGDNIIYLFERKTWADLASSIVDGRLTKQIRNMQEMQCIKYFIIEGQLSYERDTEVGGIPFYKLDAMRRKLIILGFRIIQTRNPQHTVNFLCDFTVQLERDINEDPITRQLYGFGGDTNCELNLDSFNIVGASEKSDKLVVRREYTDDEIKVTIWSQFPAVGPTILPSISKYSLIAVSNMSESAIADIKNENGRRFGVSAAGKVRAVFDALNDKSAIAIMAEFPGISKKSATYINSTTTLRQFINDDMTTVKKSAKTAIGQRAAERIKLLSNL